MKGQKDGQRTYRYTECEDNGQRMERWMDQQKAIERERWTDGPIDRGTDGEMD